MAYSNNSGRLPFETASKLGHLEIIKSEWVRDLIDDFDSISSDSDIDICGTNWEEFSEDTKPINNIWAVDGSFAKVLSSSKPQKEVAFVKTALLMVDQKKIEQIDKENPHPLHMKSIMNESALFHATVFPLNNIRTSKGSNYHAIRNIIFDSLKNDEKGAYFETYKWLIYKKWNSKKSNSPEFSCPHCFNEVTNGFTFNEERMNCPECHKEILITDILGFHMDMLEDRASSSIVTAYMLIMETLMLFTPIRLYWEYKDAELISNTLFIKDGPLSLSSQYSKIVPNIRSFLEFSKTANRPVHIIGCEKSGKFFDHLMSVERFTKPNSKSDPMTFSVLSHKYIIDEVQRRPASNNQYGSRTNWGEKVFLKIEPGNSMVINIPTGLYNSSDDFPSKSDLIGFDRILSTIPTLISRKFEGALFPIELANGISSLSSYPSSKILERYIDDNR